jgi:hypothetical protein
MSEAFRILAEASGLRGREVIPRIITVAQPAAGAEWTVSVPGGALWLIQTIRCTFQTSATVANRVPRLLFSDGTTEYMRIFPNLLQAAGSTFAFTFVKGLGTAYSQGVTAMVALPSPEVPIIGGHSITASTQNLDPGDQWSAIALFVLEVEETPFGVEVARDMARLESGQTNAVPQLGA